MHLTAFREIVRDAEIANAILPIVRQHQLSAEATEKALVELHVPRAANVAAIARFTQ
jgi:hypothetical protein